MLPVKNMFPDIWHDYPSIKFGFFMQINSNSIHLQI